MQLVADENVSAHLVAYLRDKGFQVVWIAETAPGIEDPEVLAMARDLQAILITYDRDFGELVFARGAAPPLNIIHSRLGRAEPELVAIRIMGVLANDLPAHHMVTIKRDDVRLTAFPDGA